MEVSKTIVYKNGDTLNTVTVRELLFRYWQLTAAEKRSFDKMVIRYPGCPDKWETQFDKYLNETP